MELNVVRIQNELRQLVLDGTFYTKITDRHTGKVYIEESKTAKPVAVLANEVASQFGMPDRNRQRMRRERQTWTFQVKVQFSEEVALEPFEEALIANPPVLTHDAKEGLPQVRLDLIQSVYDHPVQQEAETGTAASLTVQASVNPT